MFFTESNQITIVAFQPVQLAQASFLSKKQTLQNVVVFSFSKMMPNFWQHWAISVLHRCIKKTFCKV